MTATAFTPFEASLGGVMIGIASAWSLAMNGKIPGISGICSRALQARAGDTAWRVVFLLGMVLGGLGARALYATIWEDAFVPGPRPGFPLALLITAGLLVGAGSRVGGGCTSGHGVCGIGRGSKPAILATCVFMASGAATVYTMRHLLGGAA